MKRIILSAALALSLSGAAAFAQTTAPAPAPTTKPHHHNPHREAVKLSQRLNLTPDQTAKLEPILADRDQKLTAMQSDTTLTPQQFKQQRRALHKDVHQQLSTVLTPDQMQQMRSMHRKNAAPTQPLPTSPSGL